ncbi:MAG: type IX secretion system sortase PorU [Microscillaceae bacterium]|nr:type IX secretion system sortase PorU [Microscillaceae bacterium]MDW8460934.1 type IX secretion system sortase PorU [Cytophagales bacterium]
MKHLILLISLNLVLCQIAKAQYAANSVLAEGNFYKIAVLESGIYRLDFETLKRAGIPLESINPQNIHLWGYGGGSLPQANSAFRYDDLPENAIWVEGEQDGKFDSQDFILFYAQSPHKISYNSSQQLFEHEINVYSDTTFYFLSVDNRAGLRIGTQPNLSGATQTIDTYNDFQFHERNDNNILNSGREWFGEVFDANTSQTVNFNVTGIVPNSMVRLTSSVLGRFFRDVTFSVRANGQEIGQHNVALIFPETYAAKGTLVTNTFNFNSDGNANLQISLTLNRNGASGIGHLNFLRINYLRRLQLYGNQTQFRSIASTSQSISQFVIDNVPNNISIWDITNPQQPANQQFILNGSQAIFSTQTNTLREFIVFRRQDFRSPVRIQAIPNQNLHALSTPNLVIVTHPRFLSEANRLANFRRTNDNLSVHVVTTEQIYNEFASGRQDISAIRDFVRMLYKRNPNELRYLLLFGAASFDYKKRIPNNNNLVPVYESYESLHPIFSYSSDDYFGFLEDNEGTWAETFSGDHTLEIGIGRLPVRTLREATAVVNKLISYATNSKSLHDWKNRISFFADDGDANIHQYDADQLAQYVAQNHLNWNIEKFYIDAFPRISTPTGALSPEVRDALNREVQRGALIINFTGHGGEVGWTEEKILDHSMIESWKNLDNMPLFVTATCEFGKYDNPRVVSGGEKVLLNPRGGGIALITTTRPVFSSTNFLLNQAFYRYVFEPINGEMPRLGQIMRKTKNGSLNGPVNRNFSLLGDPSMRLAYPKEQIVITHLNDKPIHLPTDTLKALSKVTVRGEVRNQQNQLLTWNGKLSVTIFDKPQEVKTLGQKAPVMSYEVRNSLIFRGEVSVRNGVFEFTFPIPKNIDYQFGKAKFSFYAVNDARTTDAAGYNLDFVIGGTNPQANLAQDRTPPQIQLFMENEQFKEGGTVPKNTTLIVKLQDESGISLTNTNIGQNITATLNAKAENTYLLNNYYKANKDTYQGGSIYFPLFDLPKGKNFFVVRAWDTFNNEAIETINFFVETDAVVALKNVLNYPNPMTQSTTFSVEHNREGDELEMFVEIYNSQGALIQTLKTEFSPADSHSPLRAEWNGLDNRGNRVGKGVYMYRLIVKSLQDKKSSVVSSKLVVIE